MRRARWRGLRQRFERVGKGGGAPCALRAGREEAETGTRTATRADLMLYYFILCCVVLLNLYAVAEAAAPPARADFGARRAKALRRRARSLPCPRRRPARLSFRRRRPGTMAGDEGGGRGGGWVMTGNDDLVRRQGTTAGDYEGTTAGVALGTVGGESRL